MTEEINRPQNKTPKSRKQVKKHTLKKVLIIAASAVIIIAGSGFAVVNHFLNKVEKIDHDAQTTLSPDEFLALIGYENTADTEEGAEANGGPAIEPDSEGFDFSFEEETERLIMIDPDNARVIVAGETASSETQASAETQVPAAIQTSYEWGQAASLNDEGLINIIMVGDDSRGSGNARSDVIMLLSINPNSHRISLVSFMRDMYLPIQGGYSSRINHAYEAGGLPLLYQCLQNNFGLHIDGGVKLDFTGFSKAVDALGGVDISLSAAEAKSMISNMLSYSGRWTDPSTIHEGMCHLDGNAALAYCRIRKIDNDFNRTARQRKMLTTLFNQFKSSGNMGSVLNTVLAYCATDMSNGTIMGYAGQVISSMGSYSLNTYRLPADGAYRAVNIRGMDVLQSIQSRNISALRSYLPY